MTMPRTRRSIGFIGAGKMATALIAGILSSGLWKPQDILASDRHPASRAKVRKAFGIRTVKDNRTLSQKASIIFLSVKPQDIDAVLSDIKDLAEGKLVISIAAGISLGRLENAMDARFIRVMPNTPCLVGEMASAFSLGKNVTVKDERLVRSILGSNGLSIKVKEARMDAVTALSGSGPAFFAYFIERMVRSSMKVGLGKDDAYALAIQTCLGTGKLLRDRKLLPSELIAMVKSKGGTTEAGLDSLKRTAFNANVEQMIAAAYRRSKELGKHG
ncbi:MAG: pyrroline-5-carboxylate reductase [DPANN group archaeon]|nr:pyrroline-5-carboxylate reductase [DPANN group archaeon]